MPLMNQKTKSQIKSLKRSHNNKPQNSMIHFRKKTKELHKVMLVLTKTVLLTVLCCENVMLHKITRTKIC